MDFLTSLITTAKNNPLLVFAWTLLLSSIGYVIKYESTYSDDAQELESFYVKYQNSISEYNKMDSSFELWKSTIRQIVSIVDSISYLNSKEAKDIAKDDILNFVGALAQQRAALDDILILLENARFKNQVYADISKDILSDAKFQDTYIKERGNAIIQLFKNGTQYEFKNTFEDVRRFKQIDNRIAEIEKSLTLQADEHNSLLRSAQLKEKSAKFKSNLSIAAWTYIFAFIGGCLGFLIGRKRRRRKNKSKTDSTMQNSDLSKLGDKDIDEL